MQIDVAGGSIIAETSNSDPKFGDNPTHATILPNHTRLFVASAGSVSGGVDTVAGLFPPLSAPTPTRVRPPNTNSFSNQKSSISPATEAPDTATRTLPTPPPT